MLMVALPLGAQAAKGAAAPVRGPEWSQLTADQQRILAPLADDMPSFFVNGRPVRDKLFFGAVRAAYADVLRTTESVRRENWRPCCGRA